MSPTGKGGLEVKRGFDKDDMLKAVDGFGERPMSIHFRFATHGQINISNNHPFHVADNLYMMHNGIVDISEVIDPNMSDTWHFTKNELSVMKNDPTLLTNPAFLRMIETKIGWGNKMVLMHGNGEVVILNEGQGLWHKGLWMSNAGGLPIESKWERKRERSRSYNRGRAAENYVVRNNPYYYGLTYEEAAELYELLMKAHRGEEMTSEQLARKHDLSEDVGANLLIAGYDKDTIKAWKDVEDEKLRQRAREKNQQRTEAATKEPQQQSLVIVNQPAETTPANTAPIKKTKPDWEIKQDKNKADVAAALLQTYTELNIDDPGASQEERAYWDERLGKWKKDIAVAAENEAAAALVNQ
jgi:hypothetical protein